MPRQATVVRGCVRGHNHGGVERVCQSLICDLPTSACLRCSMECWWWLRRGRDHIGGVLWVLVVDKRVYNRNQREGGLNGGWGDDDDVDGCSDDDDDADAADDDKGKGRRF